MAMSQPPTQAEIPYSTRSHSGAPPDTSPNPASLLHCCVSTHRSGGDPVQPEVTLAARNPDRPTASGPPSLSRWPPPQHFSPSPLPSSSLCARPWLGWRSPAQLQALPARRAERKKKPRNKTPVQQRQTKKSVPRPIITTNPDA